MDDGNADQAALLRRAAERLTHIVRVCALLEPDHVKARRHKTTVLALERPCEPRPNVHMEALATPGPGTRPLGWRPLERNAA